MLGFNPVAARGREEAPASEPASALDPSSAAPSSVDAEALAASLLEAARREYSDEQVSHAVDRMGLTGQDFVYALLALGARYEAARAGELPLREVADALRFFIVVLPPEFPRELEVAALDMLGSALCIGGDNEQGITWLADAKRLCDEVVEDPGIKCDVYQHYGNALRNTGQLVDAVDVLQRAVEWSREVGGVAFLESLVNVSVVYGDLGHDEAEEQALETAARAAGAAGLDRQLAVCHSNLGSLSKRRGDLDGAEEHFTTAIGLAEQIGDRRLAAGATGNLAAVEQARGELDQALDRYGAAFAAALELDDGGTAAHAVVGMAEVFALRGDAERAEETLRSSLDLVRSVSPQRTVHVLGVLARTVASRDAERALTLLDEAVEIGERMRAGATLPQQVPALQRELAGIYSQRAAIMLSAKRVGDAFDEIELGRAALLSRYLVGDDPRRVSPRESVAAALRRAAASAVLVSYYLLDDEVLIFIMRADDAEPRLERRPVTVAELAHVRDDVEAEVSHPPGQFPEETWTRIGDVLLAPVLPHLRDGDTLLLVPHGPLHGLPLHALQAGGARLIERWPVAYLPSGSALTALVGDLPDPRALRMCVIGSFFPEEAALVADVLDVDRVVDPAAGATKDDVMVALSRHEVVHLSAHGYNIPHFPSAAGLELRDSAAVRDYLHVLAMPPEAWSPADRQMIHELRSEADDALLTVKDIEATGVPAELVCLSACSSGVVGIDPADEPIGLVPALLRAGAAGVVASLWMVDAGTTEALMGEFYRALSDRPDGWSRKPEALRAASLAVMQSEPHPYYWAAFVLVGGLTSEEEGA
jgi:CHAT domain-containing protein/tetratricopeptide (TPR) repeat protein